MAIVPQHAAATADAAGRAVFMFPEVPVGELWSGTATIPNAPVGALATVTAGGALVGSMQGPGTYGPWTCDHSQRLAIAATSLVPGTQYVAVWHADNRGAEFSTYPATITTAVSGTVDVPQPVEVDVLGAVTVDQGSPASWAVTAALERASSVTSGQRTVQQGVALPGPNLPAVIGVVISARFDNTSLIGVGGDGTVTGVTGLILNPGQMTPLLPVTNANVLWVAGNNNSDVVSFLVL